jgi:DNA-binding FadR family transcriptional regulator
MTTADDTGDMPFAAISRAAVSDAVFGQLVDAILTGRVAPDDALPSERELAETFQVNRHAVREALRRVQHSGLIRVAHGGKTRVLDWRTHAGLDILSALAASGAVPQRRILRDLAVMRRSVAADAARLCAQHAEPDRIAELRAAADRYPRSTTDLLAAAADDLAYWTVIIDGSSNVAYRLALNTLVDGYAAIGWETVARLGLVHEYADRDSHLRLAELIAAGDGDGAFDAARHLLGRTVAALDGALDGIDDDDAGAQ